MRFMHLDLSKAFVLKYAVPSLAYDFGIGIRLEKARPILIKYPNDIVDAPPDVEVVDHHGQ